MTRTLRALGAGLVAAALATACSSSSTSPSTPKPVTGTSHATVTQLSQGQLFPDFFDVTVTQQGSVYGGTMPDTLTRRGMKFDATPFVGVGRDTLYGALSVDPALSNVCFELGFEAVMNAARDSAIGFFGVLPSAQNGAPLSCTADGRILLTR